MITIKLFCGQGMSTMMMVKKMEEAAKKRGIEVTIGAYAESQLKNHLDGLDLALLGPQVAHKLAGAKKICQPAGVPVAVIPSVDYGMMNGEKVLDFALKLIEENKKSQA